MAEARTGDGNRRVGHRINHRARNDVPAHAGALSVTLSGPTRNHHRAVCRTQSVGRYPGCARAEPIRLRDSIRRRGDLGHEHPSPGPRLRARARLAHRYRTVGGSERHVEAGPRASMDRSRSKQEGSMLKARQMAICRALAVEAAWGPVNLGRPGRGCARRIRADANRDMAAW